MKVTGNEFYIGLLDGGVHHRVSHGQARRPSTANHKLVCHFLGVGGSLGAQSARPPVRSASSCRALPEGESPTPTPARQWHSNFCIEVLVGGGLRRSLKALGPTKERVDYDEGVLGGSEFVSRLREHEALRDRLRPPLTLEELPRRIGQQFGLTAEEVCRKSRNPAVVQARATPCYGYVAVRELGYRTAAVAAFLHMTPSGVSIAIRREQPRLDPECVRHVLQG